jgi:arabinofuranosyltransferase
VITRSTIGLFGYYTGNNVYIVDPMALADPLLSKLPSTAYWLIYKHKSNSIKKWRIGHFARKLPAGYLETIKTGENQLEDKGLRRYYEKLTFVIRGDLFNINRLKEIINFNLGKYNYLLKSYDSKLKNQVASLN